MTWLPVSAAELVQLLREARFEDASIENLADIPDKERGNPSQTPFAQEMQRLRGILTPGETVSVITSRTGQIFIFVIGRGDRLHTLRVTLPVVNFRQDVSDRVMRTLKTLFKRTYPQWQQAEDWPVESLKQAWNLKRIRAGGDPIVLHRQDGITSATFGVPPDILAYTITARQRCVPTKEQRDHFQRSVC